MSRRMTGKFKQIKERVLLFLASLMGPILIYALGMTLRIKWIGLENLNAVREEKKSVIYAFWHGRMLIFTYSHRRQGIHVLISQHRDGEFIARIIHRLGFVSVRGSTTRGGSKAVFQMCERSTSGFDVALTPDGPKGPRFLVHPGTMYIAQRSRRPIVPITNSAKDRWSLSTWDRFMIPKPFSKVIILLGKPIWVPADCPSQELEKLRLELETRLQELTQKADNYFCDKVKINP